MVTQDLNGEYWGQTKMEWNILYWDINNVEFVIFGGDCLFNMLLELGNVLYLVWKCDIWYVGTCVSPYCKCNLYFENKSSKIDLTNVIHSFYLRKKICLGKRYSLDHILSLTSLFNQVVVHKACYTALSQGPPSDPPSIASIKENKDLKLSHSMFHVWF